MSDSDNRYLHLVRQERTPKKEGMMDEKYKYFLNTGSGRTSIDLSLHNDESAVMEIHTVWMASGNHQYHLLGKHKRISDVYGWLLIEQMKHSLPLSENPEQNEELNLDIIQAKVIYEYFKVSHSPNIEHPDDLGLMHQFWGLANWNETFDMLVIIHKSVQQNLLCLLDYGDVWSEEPADPEYIKQLVYPLLNVDKIKFTRVME
ncbi:MAG: hypothetical protein HY866_22985 [Chloroflexi bacterium]|nr:hypothetical protein [Chloroflexota bacterium]